MKKINSLVLAFVTAFTITASNAYATNTSTINPNNPAQNSALSSATLRANFLCAYNDINNIYALIAGIVTNSITSLTGDVTTGTPASGVATATVGKVNGVSYSATPGTNTVPVVTNTNTVTYEAVPNAALANSTMTIAGHSVALGGTQTLAASDMTNGTTGTGAVVLATSPTLVAPNIGTATGSITGNAATATALQNAQTINGVSFNGTTGITVTAAAGTLTGTALASNVATSSLTSFGTLTAPVNLGTPAITDTNVLLQATSNVNSYNQLIIQNSSNGTAASTNYVVNNNLGTANTYYGEFGMNSSGYTGTGAFNQPNNVYLDSQSGDLAIGTLTSNSIHFVVNNGATDAVTIGTTGLLTANTSVSSPFFAATGTGANTLPVGTTGQAPSPINGMIRYDSTLDKLRASIASGWQSVFTTSDVIPVANGGTGTNINPSTGNASISIGPSGGTGTGTILFNQASSGTVVQSQIQTNQTGSMFLEPHTILEISPSFQNVVTGALEQVYGNVAIGTSYLGLATPTNGLIVSGSTGIGTSAPLNELDVAGNTVIGASYAGVNAAPGNGLLVQGNVGIGTASVANTLDIGAGAIHIGSSTPGSTSNALYVNGSTLYFNGSPVASGGGTSAGGSNGQVQVNASGVLGGVAAGNGIVVGTTTINTTFPGFRNVSSSTDTITASDGGAIVNYNRSSAIAVSIAAASTTGLTSGFATTVNNLGAGVVTITPTTSTINGAATLVIPANVGCTIYSDSTNYQIDMSSCGNLYFFYPNNDTTSLALGSGAFPVNTGNNNSVGMGSGVFHALTTGTYNIALGYQALYFDVSGSFNTAIGEQACQSCTSGSNTAIGQLALKNASSGGSNTAIGGSAGSKITTGGSNTVLGVNVATTTLTTGSSNILIGTSSTTDSAGSADTNEIAIGGLGLGSNTFEIGKSGTTTAGTLYGNVTATGTIKTAGYTVSTLPAGTVGMRAYVTDQNVACVTAGAALTGSGGVTCPVFYNGSAWVGD